ncbi:MAG: helix-turn-helix transcriptional regulator [Dinghuibacter sp.]|nr:helix-turn-helix transcriptional regulator [Dinghuibacter sp.]
MTLSVGERFTQFLRHKNLNPNEVADMMGYSSKEKIYRWLRDKEASPSYETIADIARRFPELNLDWWLLGIGDMLKRADSGTAEHLYIVNSGISDLEKIALLSRMLDTKSDEIKRLRDDLQVFRLVLEKETGKLPKQKAG